MTGERAVLIVTQDFDPTVDPVVRALAAKNVDVRRFDLSLFPQALTFSSSDFTGSRLMRVRGRPVDLDEVGAVWYRRPTAFTFSGMQAAEEEFARAEAMKGVGGLLRSTDCLWVNRPDADAVADLKPYQLSVAKQVGLRVPRTLLTNDPDEVRELLESGEKLIYKPLSGGLVTYPGGRPTGLITELVDRQEVPHLGRVAQTMCLFQEYVEKSFELRVTVIGNTFFPVAIDSQHNEGTRIDWRKPMVPVGTEAPADGPGTGSADDNAVPYGPYHPLPGALLLRLRALMDRLNLVYGAIDLIVRPDGEYVFLEVNPGGQFMWMHYDLGLPLDDCMAELLAHGRDFVRSDPIQVGY